MFKKKIREIETAGDVEVIKEKKKRKAMSKKKKRLIVIGIIIAVIVLLVILSKALSGGEITPQVSVGTVEKMDIEQVVSIKGTIQGSQSADVVSALNYEIISILVEEGDIVKEDQVLAILDAGTLQDEYNKAISSLEESRFKYEASKLLYDEGAISKEEYIRSKTAYENDRTNVSSYDVSEKTNIKSPISGTVTRVNVNLGRYANDTKNKEPMFIVEDLENLKMDVKISEYDISKIKVGQNVTITAEVLGSGSVKGTVTRISPTGEPKDQTSKEMVIPVQIDVVKGNTNLIAGVTAKAKILVDKKENVLSVPIDAVLEETNKEESYVMVLDGKMLKKVPVTLGLEGDFNIEIISGNLSSGDQVVLSPTFDMKDGMEVIALPQQ